MTLRAWEVTDPDIDLLRSHGFSDRAIFDATQITGFFNSINRVADALDVDLDPGMPERKPCP